MSYRRQRQNINNLKRATSFLLLNSTRTFPNPPRCCSVLLCVAEMQCIVDQRRNGSVWLCVAESPCVVLCCSVFQHVAVCFSVLQCVSACCSVFQRVAVCFSVLQCVASGQTTALQHTASHRNTPRHTATHRNTPQHTRAAKGGSTTLCHK